MDSNHYCVGFESTASTSWATGAFFVEQVGYDPTPSDFQSAAMTTSATTPKCRDSRIRTCDLLLPKQAH